MFQITIGQLSNDVKQKSQADPGCEVMEAKCDTIKLLNKLQEMCHKDAQTKVHRQTNVL